MDYLRSSPLAGETTLTLEVHGFVNRHVRQDQTHILLPDESVLVKIVDIEGKLDLSLNVGIVDLKKPMHKFLQIYVAVTVQVQNREKPFSNDAWQLRILYKIFLSKY